MPASPDQHALDRVFAAIRLKLRELGIAGVRHAKLSRSPEYASQREALAVWVEEVLRPALQRELVAPLAIWHRAWDELRDHGDAEYFLRIVGGEQRQGDAELIERVHDLPPVKEFAAEAARRDERRARPEELTPLFGTPGERDDDPPCFDWMTMPELIDWGETWGGACKLVAEFRRDRMARSDLAALARGADPDQSAAQHALAELTSAELLVFAASSISPRGFAAGDQVIWRKAEYARRRFLRAYKKFSESTVE